MDELGFGDERPVRDRMNRRGCHSDVVAEDAFDEFDRCGVVAAVVADLVEGGAGDEVTAFRVLEDRVPSAPLSVTNSPGTTESSP
jgi:hypothetical protein